jgi:hypothetical protein
MNVIGSGGREPLEIQMGLLVGLFNLKYVIFNAELIIMLRFYKSLNAIMISTGNNDLTVCSEQLSVNPHCFC